MFESVTTERDRGKFISAFVHPLIPRSTLYPSRACDLPAQTHVIHMNHITPQTAANFESTSSASPTAVRRLGRAANIEEALSTAASGIDVIIEAEIGMGASALALAITDRAPAHGLRPVQTVRLPRAAGAQDVLVADVTAAVPAEFDLLRNARGTRTTPMILITRPHAMFSAPTHPFLDSVRPAAHTITLRPLTRTESDQIAEDLVRNGTIDAMPSSVERHWAWVTGAGIARLVESLLHDLAESPEEEGALSRFSRRTIVVASEIVGALPAPLLRLACRLLPLVGTRLSRLTRVVDRVDIGLLQEAHIISECGGLLCIPAPLQSALRLLIDDEHPDDLALSVILDICAAVDVDAEYDEDELRVVVGELSRNATLRDLVPSSVQDKASLRAMHLARRRGDVDEAAALARRTLGRQSVQPDETLRTIARGLDDDFLAAAASVREQPQLPDAESIYTWLHCMQLPGLTAVTGAIDLVDAVLERLILGSARSHVQGLRDSLTAAQMLDDAALPEALAVAERVVATADAGGVARLRALAVAAAVHAERLDGESLTALTVNHIGLLAEAADSDVPTIIGDLRRHQALDCILTLARCFTSIGVDQPDDLIALIDHQLTRAFRLARHESVTLLVMCTMLQAIAHGDRELRTGCLRLIRRKRRTDVSQWIVTVFDGDRAVMPRRLGGGRSDDLAIASGRLVGQGARGDLTALASALNDIPPGYDLLNRLASAALAVFQDLRSCPASDATAAELADVPLTPGTIPAALRDVITGVERDADALQRAAATLLDRRAVPLAVLTLELAAPLVTGDRAAERELHRLQREARSRRHPGVSAPVGLTPREREIALLAAEGLSNRDIARTLFLSVRTVESHLYRAMRKSAVTREGLWVLQEGSEGQVTVG